MAWRLVLLLSLSVIIVVDSRLIKVISHGDDIEIDIEDDVAAIQMTNAATDVPAAEDSPSDGPAKACISSKCKLPHCRCSGTDIPGNLAPSHTPQMVVFTFSNAIRPQDMHLYEEIFQNRTNPNHCPASATFFVSHNWTHYSDVNRLYTQGHEIGNNGVNEKTIDWWKNASFFQWIQMMTDQNQILSKFADIPLRDIRGWRTPFLEMGGDRMFWSLYVSGLRYDSTRVGLNYPSKPNLIWPFTYDYLSTQTCPIGTCPKNSYPGLWENTIEALPDKNGIPYADVASAPVANEQEAYNLLFNGFQARYKHNRAPLVIQMKIDWLLSDYKLRGTKRFLDTVMSHPDVYVVSSWRALSWAQNPQCVHCTPQAFRCDPVPPKQCANPVTCQYDANRKLLPHGGGVYVSTFCTSRCPVCYPALGDPLGTKCAHALGEY